jgi:hypothetical protein
MAAETALARPWLAEMTVRHGRPAAAPGRVRLRGEDGWYVRECWAWLVRGGNRSVVIDRYPGHWAVRADGPGTRLVLERYGSEEPAAAEIRAVLVLAGLLEARDA